jgi:D-sedoheptulose 7-phosphate isomerase
MILHLQYTINEYRKIIKKAVIIMNKNSIKKQILESIKTKEAIIQNGLNYIEDAAEVLIESIKSSCKILWCGNGGSAADAQHLATELMGGMSDHDRMPIPSIALTTDSSFITAWSNDLDFESIFSRQIQGLGNEGDVLIGISTSGNSKNVISAIKQANFKKLKTIVLTGKSGGKIDGLADITIKVPSEDTQRIQEAHIMIGQILCDQVENSVIEN